MSIQILIEKCLENETLFILHPSAPEVGAKRIIYLSPVVMEFLGRDDFRSSRLLSELEAFVMGDIVSISMIPRNARSEMMGMLEPIENGLFDYRSRAPRPGLRLIGGFARKDCFIALGMYLRRTMNEPEWRAAIRECDLAWAERFKKHLPMMTGVDPSDYLSNYFCMD